MNQSKFIVKTTENSQKVKVGLRHLEDSILVDMKGKEYIVESTGVIQKRSRSKSSTHEQYTSQYPINEEITLSRIKSRHSPKCDTCQIADMLQSKKCETNHGRLKDEVKIMSGKRHWHRSPDGTLVGQSSKSRKYCDASPNRLHDDGQVRKDERNHEEQQSGEHWRRSCSKGPHETPDGRNHEQSERNRIKCDVQDSANPSSDGHSRNNPKVHYVQGSHLIGRSRTPDLNSPAVRRHDRHVTKSLVDQDDNFRTNVSRCQTSNIQTTGDVSHDGCTPQEEIHERGLGLLGKNHDASPNLLNVSMFNTHERQTDRYCIDEQKESHNECEFTCETKADLEKHSSEVYHKDCVLSRHGEGTDKSKNSVEEVKRIFLLSFQMKRKMSSLYIWL